MAQSHSKQPNSKQLVQKPSQSQPGKIKPGGSTLALPKALCLKMLDLMIQSRVLEERLIKIYKAGEAYFWIGAPGEEAWGVPLGLHVHKGRGHDYDYLHLHYRGTPTLLAMGMPMIDAVRLMMNRATDKSSGGKNFSGHYCYTEWNVVPVSSPIEVQYSMAIGTAWAQRRHQLEQNSNRNQDQNHDKKKSVNSTSKYDSQKSGITIVTGGDAGSAEGDFASGLIWATRKNQELPMLITVQNNRWGISTSYDTQHGENNVADRGKAFQMRTAIINGNDPIETYIRLEEEMNYIRKTGKPVLLEARVSRLFGHSSASGANPIAEEDCVQEFSKKLLKADWITEGEIKEIYSQYEVEARRLQDQVREEPAPQGEDIWKYIYVDNENADWRKF